MSEKYWGKGQPFTGLTGAEGSGQTKFWSAGLPLVGLPQEPLTYYPRLQHVGWRAGLPFVGLDGGTSQAGEGFWWHGQPGVVVPADRFIVYDALSVHLADNLELLSAQLAEVLAAVSTHLVPNLDVWLVVNSDIVVGQPTHGQTATTLRLTYGTPPLGWTSFPFGGRLTRPNLILNPLAGVAAQSFFGQPYLAIQRAASEHLSDTLELRAAQIAAVLNTLSTHLADTLDVQLVQIGGVEVLAAISTQTAQNFRLLDWLWNGWAGAPNHGRFARRTLTSPNRGLQAAGEEAFFGKRYLNLAQIATSGHLLDGPLAVPQTHMAGVQATVHGQLADLLISYLAMQNGLSGHLADDILVFQEHLALIANTSHGHTVKRLTLVMGLLAGQRLRGGKGLVDGVLYPYRSET